MRHPPRDPWWRWAALDGKYAGVTAAVLNLSGWFDEPYGPGGAVANHLGLAEARSPDSLRSRLVLGPWTHGGQETRQAGDRDFGASAAIDYTATVLDWMDRYVKDAALGAKQAPAVRVFVMGANQWRSADRWPFPGTRPDTLYLQASESPAKVRSPPPSPGHGSAATECYRVRPSRPARRSIPGPVRCARLSRAARAQAARRVRDGALHRPA